MRKPWKLAIVAVAVLALGGGIVVAQTDSDPARPFSNFVSLPPKTSASARRGFRRR